MRPAAAIRYTSARRRSVSSLAEYVVKRAAAAPSITRWSYESDSGSISRGTNALPSQTGFMAPRHAEDRHLGRIDDRCEGGTADAAEAGIEKHPPCMSAGPSLPSRALAESSPISFAISSTPFWSTSLITGTTSPFGVSAAKPMLKYCLQHQVVAVERRVEVRELLQRRDRRLDEEREHRDLDAGLLVFLVERDAQRFEAR